MHTQPHTYSLPNTDRNTQSNTFPHKLVNPSIEVTFLHPLAVVGGILATALQSPGSAWLLLAFILTIQ